MTNVKGGDKLYQWGGAKLYHFEVDPKIWTGS